MDLHAGVQSRDGGLCRCHFRLVDRLGGVNDLALQVGQVDCVVIDDGERPDARSRALTIAAYLQAKLVDIHPFSDGNGRTARLLMNWALLSLGHPPIVIYEKDKLAYFGALDAFHDEKDLDPLRDFLRVECVKTWQGL